MIRRSGLSAALVLALAGCAAGPAPSDHFYRLEAGAPTKTFEPPPLSGTIEVRRFRADAVTAERRIVLRREGEPTLQLKALDAPTRERCAIFFSLAGSMKTETLASPSL